jgi:hypothetical protein
MLETDLERKQLNPLCIFVNPTQTLNLLVTYRQMAIRQLGARQCQTIPVAKHLGTQPPLEKGVQLIQGTCGTLGTLPCTSSFLTLIRSPQNPSLIQSGHLAIQDTWHKSGCIVCNCGILIMTSSRSGLQNPGRPNPQDTNPKASAKHGVCLHRRSAYNCAQNVKLRLLMR